MARKRLNSSNAPEVELPKAKLNKETLNKVSHLLSYIKPYRGKFIAALFFLFARIDTGHIISRFYRFIFSGNCVILQDTLVCECSGKIIG